MHTVQVGKTWVIWNGNEPYGPYETRKEAESDRIGMEKFLRHQDKPGFFTSEKPHWNEETAND
jgi:hypothetical protein